MDRPAPRDPERLATPLALTLLLVATLLPYPALLTFDAVHVPDDLFASDLFGLELPLRASVGRMLRAGSLPVWEPGVYGGVPVMAFDPLGALCFGLLPPAAALDAFLLVTLVGAAGGAFALARRLGASRAGALLAGFAWAHSGVMTAQLRHPSIVLTVAATPLALCLLDRALDPAAARPARRLALFALVLGWQALAGFPQSVYAALIAYGLWALGRLAALPRGADGRYPWARAAALGLGFGAACAAGVAMGAAALLPTRELASLSDRAGGVSWAFASRAPYWPRAALGFLLPHLNGDASDGTYRGPDIFWESYGYVGLATAALAVGAAVAGRRNRPERALLAIAAVAYLFVLGANTPFYRFAWEHLPAFRGFRLPQRFLFLVDLSLVTLAALGLTRFERWYAARLDPPAPRRARAVAAALVALVVLDLCAWQPRQNPFVRGAAWLAPPESARALLREPGLGRIVSLGASPAHLEAYHRGPGWRSTDPFFAQRESLEPDTQTLWGFDSADGYHPLPLRGPLFVWGHYGMLFAGAAGRLHHEARGRVAVRPFLATLLAMQGVTHVLAPVPVDDARFVPVASRSTWRVHRLADPLGRAWYAAGAEAVADPRAALARAQAPGYSPRRTVLLRDPPGPVAPAEAGAPAAAVAWRRPEAHRIEVTVDAPRAGWLVLAESWHPDWEVTVDGRPARAVEAHLVGQAVAVGPGRHVARWRFRGTAMRRGIAISLAALGALLTVATAGGATRRASARGRAARSSSGGTSC
jgi:hypothetical protein